MMFAVGFLAGACACFAFLLVIAKIVTDKRNNEILQKHIDKSDK